MNNIYQKIFLGKYKKLISNFSYLMLIEVINKILPILVVPYIVNILGIEKYGILVFSLAIIMYFKILTAYSFDLTATKFISQHRDDKKKISRYYWSIIFTKFILLFISFILLLCVIFLFEKLNLEKEILLFTFLMIVGEVMTPLWFFRGIEEMKYVAYLSVITKTIYTLSIFFLIHEENDYVYVALLNSISHLIVGILSLLYIYKKFNISFFLPNINEIKNILNEGKDIFFSNISVSMYTVTNNILLGFLVGYSAVGIYSIAGTIYGAFLNIIYTYNTVVYPYLSKYLKEKKVFILQTRKLLFFYILILTFSSIFLFFSSNFIIELLFGAGNEKTIEVLQTLALVLIISPLGGYLTHYLALKSEYKVIRKITFRTMIVNFIFVYPMITLYEANGVAYLMIIVALFQVSQNIKYNKELFIIKRNKS